MVLIDCLLGMKIIVVGGVVVGNNFENFNRCFVYTHLGQINSRGAQVPILKKISCWLATNCRWCVNDGRILGEERFWHIAIWSAKLEKALVFWNYPVKFLILIRFWASMQVYI